MIDWFFAFILAVLLLGCVLALVKLGFWVLM
jgi:hypothetical protein